MVLLWTTKNKSVLQYTIAAYAYNTPLDIYSQDNSIN